MLLRLLAFFRRPRATDFPHYRAQLDLLQTQMEIVNDGFRRGDTTIEDFLVQPEE